MSRLTALILLLIFTIPVSALAEPEPPGSASGDVAVAALLPEERVDDALQSAENDHQSDASTADEGVTLNPDEARALVTVTPGLSLTRDDSPEALDGDSVIEQKREGVNLFVFP